MNNARRAMLAIDATDTDSPLTAVAPHLEIISEFLETLPALTVAHANEIEVLRLQLSSADVQNAHAQLELAQLRNQVLTLKLQLMSRSTYGKPAERREPAGFRIAVGLMASYADFVSAGWSDKQMIARGLMEPIDASDLRPGSQVQA